VLSNFSYEINRETRRIVIKNGKRIGKGWKGGSGFFLSWLTQADKAWNGGNVEGSSIRDWSELRCCARQQIHQRRWAAWRFVWYSSRRCQVSCEIDQKCLLTGETLNTLNSRIIVFTIQIIILKIIIILRKRYTLESRTNVKNVNYNAPKILSYKKSILNFISDRFLKFYTSKERLASARINFFQSKVSKKYILRF